MCHVVDELTTNPAQIAIPGPKSNRTSIIGGISSNKRVQSYYLAWAVLNVDSSPIGGCIWNNLSKKNYSVKKEKRKRIHTSVPEKNNALVTLVA